MPDICILDEKSKFPRLFKQGEEILRTKSNQEKKVQKRTFIWLQNEGRSGGDPHQPGMTLNMDNFVKLLSLYPKEKRKSQSYFYGTSPRTTDGTPKKEKEKQQTKWIKTTTLLLVVARRLLLLPSKLDHLYNLTQLYPDPHPPDNQTFLALGNFRGYNWAFVKLWLLLDRIRKMTSLKLWSVTTDCSTHTDPKSPYFVQKIIFNAFLSQNLNFLAWKNTY
mgnify:CR=1 FL=1